MNIELIRPLLRDMIIDNLAAMDTDMLDNVVESIIATIEAECALIENGVGLE